MMDKYELQKLRDLPIEGVAERLGMQVVRHKSLCPFHDDHHASLSFCTRRNTFRCFACGAHGGTIDLVMKRQNVGFKEACRWLGLSPDPSPVGRGEGNGETSSSAINGVTLKASPSGGGLVGALKASPSGGGLVGARYARYFEHPFLNDSARRFLFSERHLDERVVRWCRLTSWKDRRGVAWLQTPYYDREGRLTGIQNRNLVRGAWPRFRFPQGSECGIYNLPVLNLLRPGEPLFIAEGCSDCWALLSAGHKAIAIPSATLLKRKDAELLCSLHSQLATPFHMYPDRDAPGERLFLQLRQLLPNLEHHQLPPDCKDFSEYYLRKPPPNLPPEGRLL